jgi:ParB family chromosome partitioning protein
MEESTQDRRLMGGAQVTVRARLEELAGNPDNGRDDLEEDLEELAESLRVRGQLQAVTVISREAFLKIKPQHTDRIGEEVRFVVLYGNRRLAAARRAGLDVLKIDVAASPANASELRASALVENIHRKNLAPLEEAREVAALVDDFGSQAEAARQIGYSTAWVSQRLALLNLVPELKEKLRAGELKVKEARSLGTRDPQDQMSAWEKGINRVNGAPSQADPDPENSSDSASNGPVDPEPVTDDEGSVPSPSPTPGTAPAPEPAPSADAPVKNQPVDSDGHEDSGSAPVQLMLDLEWEPAEAATEVVRAYGSARAKELAAAILAQI